MKGVSALVTRARSLQSGYLNGTRSYMNAPNSNWEVLRSPIKLKKSHRYPTRRANQTADNLPLGSRAHFSPRPPSTTRLVPYVGAICRRLASNCTARASSEPNVDSVQDNMERGPALESHVVTVAAGGAVKQRLDVFLTAELDPMSRAKVQSLIKDGHVQVNGLTEIRTKTSLKLRDQIRVDFPPPVPIEACAEDIPLEVVFEDKHLLVINKQAHLVVHPAAGNRTGTLVNAILYHCGLPAMRVALGAPMPSGLWVETDPDDHQTDPDDHHLDPDDLHLDPDDDQTGADSDLEPSVSYPLHPPSDQQPPVMRPGIVHRLDKGTSGLMVVAKDDLTHRRLCAQFAAREVKRSYVSVTCGLPSSNERTGRVVAHIGRNPRDRKSMAVVDQSKGRFAASKYMVREALAGGGAGMVEWRLETGRTHQIRVHAKHLGIPLFGDETYGGGAAAAAATVPRSGAGLPPARIKKLASDLNRPALHALTLGFVHPITLEEMHFQANPPEDFCRVVDALRGSPSD